MIWRVLVASGSSKLEQDIEFRLDSSVICYKLSVIYGPSKITLAVLFILYIMLLVFSD